MRQPSRCLFLLAAVAFTVLVLPQQSSADTAGCIDCGMANFECIDSCDSGPAEEYTECRQTCGAAYGMCRAEESCSGRCPGGSAQACSSQCNQTHSCAGLPDEMLIDCITNRLACKAACQTACQP